MLKTYNNYREQLGIASQNALKLDPTRSKTIGNYVLGKTIGKGTFGKVKLATHALTNQKVAVKILEKQRIVDVADVERVSRQIHILKLIRHPGIIQLYEIIETPKHLFLIMQYIENGQLFDYIVKCKKIPEEQACKIFQQIIGGVQYIHKLNVVHRDLKPQNILIDFDKTIRIVDFGLSNTYRKDQRLKTACGSPCYAAPQMIQGKNRYQPIMVDIWSCGVILYAMLCGCLPFEDPETSKLYQKILSGQYKIPKTLSADAKDLLSKILSVDPSQRYNIEDIRKHKWWNQVVMQNNFSHGIIVGYHKIPVQDCILDEVSQLGFQRDFTKKCIQANRHNNATTTYYLLLKKFVKQGGHSTTSLGSKYFDPTLIEPPKRSKPISITGNNLGTSLSEQQTHENGYDLPKSLHTTLTRRNYNLQKPRIDKIPKDKTQFSFIKQSKDSSSFLTGNSIQMRKTRQIQFRGRSLNSRDNYEEKNYDDSNLYEVGQDLISKKYRQTYGTSIVSKSKQRPKKHSLKKTELHSLYQNDKVNFSFNKTLESHRPQKGKSYRIGADLGHENANTIQHSINRPYIRRIVYH